MTKEEIEKRKKEIDDELDSLHEEQENLYDKITTLQTEYCDLENEEILMNSKTKFESGKFYLLPGTMDYHYNIFTLFFIKSAAHDKHEWFSYNESIFRLDDYDPSFRVEEKTKNFSDFIIDDGSAFEVDKETVEELRHLACSLNWKGAERFIKELKEKQNAV